MQFLTLIEYPNTHAATSKMTKLKSYNKSDDSKIKLISREGSYFEGQGRTHSQNTKWEAYIKKTTKR